MHLKYWLYLMVAVTYLNYERLRHPHVWLGCLYIIIFATSIDINMRRSAAHGLA